MTQVKFSPMSRYVSGQDRPVYGKYGSRFFPEWAENGDLLEFGSESSFPGRSGG